MHNLFTYCSCAVARRNFGYVNVHNSLHFVAFSLSQAGNGDCGNKTTTKATNATKKKITETKKTSFFHQKARWSCPPLSLFVSLSVTSPDKPVERPFEANLTAGSMQQGSISKGQPNKTSKNETKRHEAMRCNAMQKKNPQPAAAADDDVCYMVNFSCRFGPPTPTPTSTWTRTTNCDCFGEYLQRRETRFRKRH